MRLFFPGDEPYDPGDEFDIDDDDVGGEPSR